MTISSLLAQFDAKIIKEIRNDIPGKTFVIFNEPYYYGDCIEPIYQFIALYDTNTMQVQAIKIYGTNMLYILKYLKANGHIFTCNFWHYMEDIRSSRQSITFFV